MFPREKAREQATDGRLGPPLAGRTPSPGDGWQGRPALAGDRL
ncbi:MAG: hypothetical protein OZSIB_0165 [Candidatus Ozemobacter sibiricus]|uniref:Uncharacterized protein n=1 Tax=Candidatus Ozemobacter sibiricus TaxID=2268124 RepID=A0A367ZME0_9BACT|nr:MAG: hypothetical protein OZSIB_0165 [Candidatus Ozemobacter sibiricus]